MGTDPQEGALDERQRRERAYHEEFALRQRHRIEQPVLLDVVSPGPRRPWNSYWTAYDLLMAQDPAGKKVLVPGCGFGEDAIRLANLGADVYASDLSPDLLEIARQRADRTGLPEIHFDVMPSEAMIYPDDFFDLVFFNDILHHVDIPATAAETRRVMKPGGVAVANELYTHSTLQKLRESRFISKFLYPRMSRFIYGTDQPYITEDEHKIDERELAVIEAILQPGIQRRFFLFLGGRVVPAGWTAMAKLDSAFLNVTEGLGRLFAGRVVLLGVVRK